MGNTNLVLVAFLIVLWWISVWGLIDTFLQPLIKGSPQKAILIYGGIFVSVAGILTMRPEWIEHFV